MSSSQPWPQPPSAHTAGGTGPPALKQCSINRGPTGLVCGGGSLWAGGLGGGGCPCGVILLPNTPSGVGLQLDIHQTPPSSSLCRIVQIQIKLHCHCAEYKDRQRHVVGDLNRSAKEQLRCSLI